MARWVVVGGDQELVVETIEGGRISVHIPSGEPFIASPEGIEDLRRKLGAAVGDARSDPPTPGDVQPLDEKTD